MDRDQLRHTAFFEHLEDFGYFSELEENLPFNFTSVFEIARVLEDEDSELFSRLEPALSVRSEEKPQEKESRGWQPNRNLPAADQYDIDFIQSVSEIRQVLPAQHALPRPIFMRRLARRELIRRVARAPVVRAFGSSAEEFAPNFFKQKVYLLLDTSASMLSHHRFQMAKATVYVFLKRNLRELGHVYFRTFDREIGELHQATDLATLRRLIRNVMRLTELGNGTVMEKAILTACEDIRQDASLSGAEILIITDGAAHLDRATITEALGSSITINTVKIGDASVALDEKILAEEAQRGNSPESHALANVHESIRHLEFEEKNASTARARSIQSELSSLRTQARRMESHIMSSMRSDYGREIESLSRVFVNVDDIAADEIFRLSAEQLDELRKLVVAAGLAFRQGLDGETLKEVALLYEHIAMLLEENDDETTEDLGALKGELGAMLEGAGESIGRGGSGISRDDLRDLGFMMQHHSFNDLSIGRLLKGMLERARKFVQFATFRVGRARRRN